MIRFQPPTTGHYVRLPVAYMTAVVATTGTVSRRRMRSPCGSVDIDSRLSASNSYKKWQFSLKIATFMA